MKSSKKKKRTSFKRKSSKKGAEVRDREQDLVLEGQRVWAARSRIGKQGRFAGSVLRLRRVRWREGAGARSFGGG